MKLKKMELQPLFVVRIKSRSHDAVDGGDGRTTIAVRFDLPGVCALACVAGMLLCTLALVF